MFRSSAALPGLRPRGSPPAQAEVSLLEQTPELLLADSETSGRPNKVLLVANTDWYLFNFQLEVARRLRDQGVVVVLASPDGSHRERLQAAGFRWVPLALRRPITPLSDPVSLVPWMALYRRERPDLVHHFTLKCVLYGTIAARLTGVPAIANTINGLGFAFSSSGHVARMLRPLLRRALTLALASPRVRVIFQQETDRRLFVDGGIVEAKQTSCVPGSGIDPQNFRPARARLAPRDESIRVLFASRWLHDKGITEFVSAARRLGSCDPRLRFLVAGAPDSGNPASVSQRTIGKWRRLPYLRLLGRRDDMPRLLRAVDIFVLPSYREGTSRVLLEAGASGLPIVTTDVPGCRDVVEHESNGLLVPPGDVDALVAAIRRLADDSVLRSRLGQAGRSRVLRRFTIDKVFRAVRSVYATLGIATQPAVRDLATDRGNAGEQIGRPTWRAGARCIKRLFDITVAAVGLVVFAPVWVMAAIAIKLEDGGPVFYRQRRVLRALLTSHPKAIPASLICNGSSPDWIRSFAPTRVLAWTTRMSPTGSTTRSTDVIGLGTWTSTLSANRISPLPCRCCQRRASWCLRHQEPADDPMTNSAAHYGVRSTLLTGTLISLLAPLPLAGGSVNTARVETAGPVIDAPPAATGPVAGLDELLERHRQWLEHEVRWIITDTEVDVFQQLQNADRRDQFIREFWRNRDPSPRTPRNEYRDQHYERLEIATQRFGRALPVPGWRTDRGRMFILLGAPASVRRTPSAQEVHPTEVWFYHADPELGIPPFFNLIFFQDRGSEYRLYNPGLDGPNGLLNHAGKNRAQQLQSAFERSRRSAIAGSPILPGRDFGPLTGSFLALRDFDPDLAEAAFNLIPGEGDVGGYAAPLRSAVVLDQIEAVPYTLMPEAEWATRVLHGATESEVRFDSLPITAAAFGVIDPSGITLLHYMVQLEGERLRIPRGSRGVDLNIEVSSSLTDRNQRSLHDRGTRSINASLNAAAAEQLRYGSVLYVDRVPAIPGAANLDVVMRNTDNDQFGRAWLEVSVPAAQPTRLSSGPAILCLDSLRIGSGYDPDAEHATFQIGDLVVLPTIDGRFDPDSEVAVFHQILVPSSHVSPIRVRYVLSDRAGIAAVEKTVRLQPWEANRHGVIDQVTRLDLVGLPSGPYRLAIDVVGDGNPGTLDELLIRETTAEAQPYLYDPGQLPPTEPALLLALAQQYHAVGNSSQALELVDEVLERDTDSPAALALQARLTRSDVPRQ